MGSDFDTHSTAAIASPARATKVAWTTRQRRLVSILLLGHLMAVVGAPWHSPPPASLLSEKVNAFFAPYQAMTYLDHGYRFFAPDPGPSHIVRYEITHSDGTTRNGQLPDPASNRPRLLYHRFFMITETMYNIWSRIETIPPTAELSPEQRQLIETANEAPRKLLGQVARGMAHQLLRQHSGTSVRLQLVEHLIPLPEDVTAGRPLSDPELYRVLADLGDFEIGKP